MVYVAIALILFLSVEVFIIRKGLNAGKKHASHLLHGSNPASSQARPNKRIKRSSEEIPSVSDTFEDPERAAAPAPIYPNVVEFPDRNRLADFSALTQKPLDTLESKNQERSMLEIIQEIRGERFSPVPTPLDLRDRGEETRTSPGGSAEQPRLQDDAAGADEDGGEVPEEDYDVVETIDEVNENELYDATDETPDIQEEGDIDAEEIEEAEEVPSAEELLKSGIHYVRQGNLEQGVANLEQAVEIAPEKAEAHFNLGIAYTLQETIPQAIEAYQRAIAIDPRYGKAFFNLGTLYLKQGNIQNAIVKLEQAVTYLTDPMKALWNLYEAYRSSELFTNALSTLQRLVELEPEDASLHNHLGICYAKLGEYKKAIQSWNRSVELGASSQLIHYNLGKTYELCGQFDDATKQYHHFLRLASNGDGWQELAGEVKERLENLERHTR